MSGHYHPDPEGELHNVYYHEEQVVGSEKCMLHLVLHLGGPHLEGILGLLLEGLLVHHLVDEYFNDVGKQLLFPGTSSLMRDFSLSILNLRQQTEIMGQEDRMLRVLRHFHGLDSPTVLVID